MGSPCYILNSKEQRGKYPVPEEVRTIARTDQHLNEQDPRGQFGGQTREHFKKIKKNRHTLDIFGNAKGSLLTQGIPKMKHKDMIGLSYYVDQQVQNLQNGSL